MRRLLAVCLVFSLIAAACGGDDDDSDGGGGGGGEPVPTEPVPTPESEPTSTQSEPQPAGGCSTDFPRRVDEPSEFSGFVVLCDVEGGAQMSIRNIGAVVLVVSPDAQQWRASDATPPPERTFAFQLVQTTIPAACGPSSCSVPPGATLTISADVPCARFWTSRRATPSPPRSRGALAT